MHNEAEVSNPHENLKRWVEVSIDPDNPPQLITPIISKELTDLFLNQSKGKTEGKVQIILAGSTSEVRRELFKNKQDLDWAKIWINLANENDVSFAMTHVDESTSQVVLRVDDILAQELLEETLDHPDVNENALTLRNVMLPEYFRIRELSSGGYMGKTLQHELDHIAMTLKERSFMQMIKYKRFQVRVSTLIGFVGTGAMISFVSNFGVDLGGSANLSLLGELVAGVLVIRSLMRFSETEFFDYKNDPVEIRARKAALHNQGLISYPDEDLQWLQAEKKYLVDYLNMIIFDENKTSHLAKIKNLYHSFVAKVKRNPK